MDTERKYAKEFLVVKEKLEKIGFEIIGTKDINEDPIYFVREKNLSIFAKISSSLTTLLTL
ncbi:MAG: hypothetical protein ACFFE4_04385 [Candidatus Thorarchaeota archaeon]